MIMCLLALVSCKSQPEEVPCSNCGGTGIVKINVPELYAMARCQLYFASHVRKCEICKKVIDNSDSPACEEATKKMESIMAEAATKPKDIQDDQCPMCGGSGLLYFESSR
jgi:RecJ-like exonuclease